MPEIDTKDEPTEIAEGKRILPVYQDRKLAILT